MLRRFLRFITGTSSLSQPMRIRPKHGATPDHLPSTHTCFQTLDMPPYESEAQLRAKFDECLQNLETIGFHIA
jgi:hypothetical protein